MKKILFLLLCFILITGCNSNSFTKEEFINQAEYNGYVLKNDLSGYENYNYIKDIYYAINRENLYAIQFLEFEDIDYAKKFYELNKEEIKNISNVTYYKYKDANSNSFYHTENIDSYMYIVRYEKQMLYIDAPIDKKVEIEEFLKDLNLEY